MAITAAQVKELRERTGSGMMECKKALVETQGDIDAAIESMRQKGQAKAEKRAGKTAAEGIVALLISDDGKTGVIVEVNSETDFVSKGDEFKAFAQDIAQGIMAHDPKDLEALMSLNLSSGVVEETRKTLVAKLGENINIRRFEKVSSQTGLVASYCHGERIGVLVDISDNANAGRDVAMHIAASRPVCVGEDQVPAELLEKEKRVFEGQAKESGKPDNIIEKMIVGRMKKYLKEITLLGQSFVKNPDQTIAQFLQEASATVNAFYRFEVGEGIEKKVENFADEVMAQARGK